jgi:hypothetical protein
MTWLNCSKRGCSRLVWSADVSPDGCCSIHKGQVYVTYSPGLKWARWNEGLSIAQIAFVIQMSEASWGGYAR